MPKNTGPDLKAKKRQTRYDTRAEISDPWAKRKNPDPTHSDVQADSIAFNTSA